MNNQGVTSKALKVPTLVRRELATDRSGKFRPAFAMNRDETELYKRYWSV